MEVSVEDNTITLSGKIPGITAESRLAFGAIDFLGGTEEVGCFLSNSLGHVPFRTCTPYDAPVRVGNAVADDLSDVPAAHIDITTVDTFLSGETLTAVFHLRDVPEALTFNRAGIPDEEPEYGWIVFVDADNDPETGYGGIDYTLSAAHRVSSSSSGSGATAPIAAGRNVQVSTRKMTPGRRLCLSRRCPHRSICRGQHDHPFRGDSRHHDRVAACVSRLTTIQEVRRRWAVCPLCLLSHMKGSATLTMP